MDIAGSAWNAQATLLMFLDGPARERWSIDPDRIVIGGFSAGAGRALEFTMDRPKSFPKVLVIEGASLKALKDPLRVQEAKEAGLRAAVLCGEAPGLFRMATDALVAELRSKGIETEYRDFPQERMHKVDRGVALFIEESIRWLLRAP